MRILLQGSRINPVYPCAGSPGGSEVSSFAGLRRGSGAMTSPKLIPSLGSQTFMREPCPASCSSVEVRAYPTNMALAVPLNPDFPDGSPRILPGTPDWIAGSATYAGRPSPVAVGVAGESDMNLRPAMQVSEFRWKTAPKSHPDSDPSGKSGINSDSMLNRVSEEELGETLKPWWNGVEPTVSYVRRIRMVHGIPTCC